MTKDARMPAVFISHGSPMIAIEEGAYNDALAAFGERVKPKAILVASAHWVSDARIRISSAAQHKLLYDFGGFPRALYALQYPVQGAPELALEIAEKLAEAGFEVQLDATRGLDHGVWIPLRTMYPKADVPVVEISLPLTFTPRELFRIGEQLAYLRERGILTMGSGGIVHNLALADLRRRDRPVDAWASAFDQWFQATLETADTEALLQYETLAPYAAEAVSTKEHFIPVFVVAGAASKMATVENIYTGFEYGNLSLRSYALVD
ncbi:MAG TPA: class III extradiol ring-cleavage dioxygenase [Acidobacteriaceae bacterium]|jgi:4,5-DOPA dioxygenase extradiol|nr:class III extradiol ring-cleavage dioxygenase [Acidobacteriaceae bacterium]